MIFVTSNENKIREIKSILPNAKVEKGRDLSEVDGTPLQVVVYKAIDAGKDRVVDDTILIINGKPVVDIRWRIDNGTLKPGSKVTWITSFGYNTGTAIKVYRGILKGTITNPKGNGFGFDPYLLPDGYKETVAQLDELGRKNEVSPRYKALMNLKHDKYFKKFKIEDIPEWKGKYQH